MISRQAHDEPVFGKFPGTNLAMLLKRCGVPVKENCGCEEWIAKMNDWGPQGCYEHRQEIIDRLKQQASQLSSSQTVLQNMAMYAKVGILALWQGVVPTIGELVDEAIWQAKEAS